MDKYRGPKTLKVWRKSNKWLMVLGVNDGDWFFYIRAGEVYGDDFRQQSGRVSKAEKNCSKCWDAT